MANAYALVGVRWRLFFPLTPVVPSLIVLVLALFWLRPELSSVNDVIANVLAPSLAVALIPYFTVQALQFEF
jgi:hypothetical protein